MCECIKIILIHSIIGEPLGNLHMEILQMALPTLFLYVSFGDHVHSSARHKPKAGNAGP